MKKLLLSALFIVACGLNVQAETTTLTVETVMQDGWEDLGKITYYDVIYGKLFPCSGHLLVKVINNQTFYKLKTDYSSTAYAIAKGSWTIGNMKFNAKADKYYLNI